MIQNGPKLSKIVQEDPKLSKMAQNHKTLPCWVFLFHFWQPILVHFGLFLIHFGPFLVILSHFWHLHFSWNKRSTIKTRLRSSNVRIICPRKSQRKHWCIMKSIWDSCWLWHYIYETPCRFWPISSSSLLYYYITSPSKMEEMRMHLCGLTAKWD